MLKYICKQYSKGQLGANLAKKIEPIVQKLKHRGVDLDKADESWFREFVKAAVPPYVLDDGLALEFGKILHSIEKEEAAKDNASSSRTPPSLYL